MSTTNKPTHEAYVVNGDGEKARWTKIGVGFFKNDGMTLLLDAVPMNARMVIRPTAQFTEAKGGPQMSAPLQKYRVFPEHAYGDAIANRYLVVLEHTTCHQILVEAMNEEVARAVARRVLATGGLEAFASMDRAAADFSVYNPEDCALQPEHQLPLFTRFDVEGGVQ